MSSQRKRSKGSVPASKSTPNKRQATTQSPEGSPDQHHKHKQAKSSSRSASSQHQKVVKEAKSGIALEKRKRPDKGVN
jgi:hypothetical protein